MSVGMMQKEMVARPSGNDLKAQVTITGSEKSDGGLNSTGDEHVEVVK